MGDGPHNPDRGMEAKMLDVDQGDGGGVGQRTAAAVISDRGDTGLMARGATVFGCSEHRVLKEMVDKAWL